MFYDEAELEKTQTKVRESATPDQLEVMKIVSESVARESDFLDAQFEEEKRLRQWAKYLCGVSLTVSEIEELLRVSRRTENSKIFVFYPRNAPRVHLYKTAFGHIDRIDNYLNTLEKTVIDVTNNSQFTALGFFGLIKLAFKNLFKRRQ